MSKTRYRVTARPLERNVAPLTYNVRASSPEKAIEAARKHMHSTDNHIMRLAHSRMPGPKPVHLPSVSFLAEEHPHQ